MAEFTEWFDENKDQLFELLDQDPKEALFQAYMVGIDEMGEFMAKLYSPTTVNNVDK